MGKFKEGEKFRLANSLQYGTVTNNNADGTYEVMMSDYHFMRLHENEMCKIYTFEKFQEGMEKKIEQVMEATTAKMLFWGIVVVMVVYVLAVIF